MVQSPHISFLYIPDSVLDFWLQFQKVLWGPELGGFSRISWFSLLHGFSRDVFFLQVKMQGPTLKLHVSTEWVWFLRPFWGCRQEDMGGHPPQSSFSSFSPVSSDHILILLSPRQWQCPELWCVTRALMDPRGEILEGLDWERSWCRGDTMGGGGLWVGHVSLSGAVENVSPYMTDLHWFMILFFHSVKQLPCGDWVRQDSISHPCIMTWRSDFFFCRTHLNVSVLLLA